MREEKKEKCGACLPVSLPLCLQAKETYYRGKRDLVYFARTHSTPYPLLQCVGENANSSAFVVSSVLFVEMLREGRGGEGR